MSGVSETLYAAFVVCFLVTRDVEVVSKFFGVKNWGPRLPGCHGQEQKL